MANIFWGETQSLICSKNCEMNNFLAILELCAFYIGYKKVKFMAINFRSQTDVKCLTQSGKKIVHRKIRINKQHNFSKNSYFLLLSSFRSIYLHKSMHKKWTFPLRISLVNMNISAKKSRIYSQLLNKSLRKTSFFVY